MEQSHHVFVKFDRINVNTIDSASSISVGTNTQLNWGSHRKINSGFGIVLGSQNQFTHNLFHVHDDDMIDTPIDDRDQAVQF